MAFSRIHGFLSTFANVKSFCRRQATKKQLQMVRETQLSIVRDWHRGVRNCKGHQQGHWNTSFRTSIISGYCGTSARFQFQPKLEDLPSSMLIGRAVSRDFYNIIGKSVSHYGGTLPSSRDAAAQDIRYASENKFGYRYVKWSPRRPLTEPQRKARLKWCIDHLRDCWLSTLFADECTVELCRQSERSWVSWRHLTEAEIPKTGKYDKVVGVSVVAGISE
jgi:hypothetical protein